MTNAQTVLVELLVAAPIEEVWRALREPPAIARWFGWDCKGLTPEIAEIFERHATVEEPGRRLTIAGTGDLFVLEPHGQGTIVRLIRAAPAEGSWDDVYDDVIEGWIMFLHQLRFALERHPADTRRTLYMSGRSRNAADPAPADAFGLSSVAAVPPGGRIAVRLATGDTIEGTVWFRTRLQLGVTVDALGDGLLIVTRRPTTSRSPHGGGAFTLTTYVRYERHGLRRAPRPLARLVGCGLRAHRGTPGERGVGRVAEAPESGSRPRQELVACLR